MESVSNDQAEEMYTTGIGHPMGFSSEYLDLVIRFILCAGTEEIEVLYS